MFEYADTCVTEMALKGLNGLPLGDVKLSLQRVPAQMAQVLLQPVAKPTVEPTVSVKDSAAEPTTSTADASLLAVPPATVIRLGNLSTVSDLMDDELFEELQEDVADECNRHGTVRTVAIPRPNGVRVEDYADTGVGYVFVQFTTIEGAGKARSAISGRCFSGRTVHAGFYPEELFLNKVSGWV